MRLQGIARSGLLSQGVVGDPRKGKPDCDLIHVCFGCGSLTPGILCVCTFQGAWRAFPFPYLPHLRSQPCVLWHTATRKCVFGFCSFLSFSPSFPCLQPHCLLIRCPPHTLGPHLTLLHTSTQMQAHVLQGSPWFRPSSFLPLSLLQFQSPPHCPPLITLIFLHTSPFPGSTEGLFFLIFIPSSPHPLPISLVSSSTL